MVPRPGHRSPHQAPSSEKSTTNAPSASYYLTARRSAIKPKYMMDTLRHAMRINFHHIGIKATEIIAQSLRAGSAMAMFFAKINMNNIRLMGHWHRYVMIRYLHSQAHTIMGHFAEAMYNNGA
jgi:hypothetical protein